MLRGALAIALLVTAGCRQLLGLENADVLADGNTPPNDSQPIDMTDGDLTPVDGCVSFSTVIDTCATTAIGPLTINGNTTYSTTTSILDDGSGPTIPQHVVFNTSAGQIDALFATTITINGQLTVSGLRPVALIGTQSITITNGGLLTVAAGGAGSRSGGPMCGAMSGGPGTPDGGGGSGGGGAGYRAAGGPGGNGDSDGGQSTGGPGGDSSPRPSAPLGGCDGGIGGTAGLATGGAGGLGGGAILLASPSIQIGGAVNAGGGGGRGGNGVGVSGAGGGGGGAGGMIVIEGGLLVVEANGAIAANGGGGGEGGGSNQNGNDGNPGNTLGTPAQGGSGGSPSGADGGTGSGNGQNFGSSPQSVLSDGGGGGGGAAGFIAIGSATVTNAGLISPMPGTWP